MRHGATVAVMGETLVWNQVTKRVETADQFAWSGKLDRTYWLRDPQRILAMGVEQSQEWDDAWKQAWGRNDKGSQAQAKRLELAWNRTAA